MGPLVMVGEESQTKQKWALLSIICVFVFVGLPLWWKTTEVYRSPLPYNEIQLLQYHPVSH